MTSTTQPRLTEEALEQIKARANTVDVHYHEPHNISVDEDAQQFLESVMLSQRDVSTLATKVDRCIEVLRSIIWASDHCQGHRDCAHSMSPWLDARELIYEFDNEQEALTELRRKRHGDLGR